MFLAKALCPHNCTTTVCLRNMLKLGQQHQHHNSNNNCAHLLTTLTTINRNYHSFSLQLYARKKAASTKTTSTNELGPPTNNEPSSDQPTIKLSEQVEVQSTSPMKEQKKHANATELRLLKQQQTIALRKERVGEVVGKLFNHNSQQNESTRQHQTQSETSTPIEKTKRKRKTKKEKEAEKAEKVEVPPFILKPYTDPEIDSIFSAILSISPKATIGLLAKQEPEDDLITVLRSKRAKEGDVSSSTTPRPPSTTSPFSAKQVNFTQYTKVESSVLNTPLEMSEEELAAEAFPTSKMPNINDNDDSDILEYLKELKNRNVHKTAEQQHEIEMTASDEAWKEVLEKPESSRLEEDLSVQADTSTQSAQSQAKQQSQNKHKPARYDQDDVVLQFLKDLIK